MRSRSRTPRTLRTLAALAPLAASAALATPAAAGAGAPAAEGPARLVDVRAAHHPGYDRLVFEFAGPLPSAHAVTRVAEVPNEATGEPVRLAGRVKLAVTLRGTVSADLDGRPTAPTRRAFGLPDVLEVARAGDFEAVTTYGVGLTSAATVRVRTLSAPSRLVLYVDTPTQGGPVSVSFAGSSPGPPSRSGRRACAPGDPGPAGSAASPSSTASPGCGSPAAAGAEVLLG